MSRNEQSAADRGEQEECHDEAACGFIVTHHHHHRAASTEDNAGDMEEGLDTKSLDRGTGRLEEPRVGGMKDNMANRDTEPAGSADLAVPAAAAATTGGRDGVPSPEIAPSISTACVNTDTPTSEESNMDTEPKQEKTESVGLQSGPIKKYEAGGAVLRGFLTQRDIPPVDPAVLADLEAQARDLASNVDRMMKSLNTTIQNMTALSVGYIQTYRDSVDSLGESVDLSIKAMYTLMARTEELDKGMQPVHSLAKQIKDVKRLLDHLENLCK
ncbi:uncharacterized protein LOC116944067 isoform X5 [Petromyzon marinus]|uniref:Uncharacterized protein LOC116944067 isoform X5 n=1 Tax=Petromyzon marinus TaxID=7757 RepID=A0AAJ7WYH4_PETMA|nr:uncharacterized protein LOC116944067 isoform X5 [Petromyzon marinus]